MIRAIIFDLDGVLIDAKPHHFKALNDALPEQYRISDEEHFSVYDGLTTVNKLQKLTALKGLPKEFHEVIVAKKNQNFDVYLKSLKPDTRKQELFASLVASGLKLYVASNAIYRTVLTAAINIGIMPYVSGLRSNGDVVYPKPNPEIYLEIMTSNGLSPGECLIVEDSPVGLEAAYASGAHVLQVKSPADLTESKIRAAIAAARPRRVVWTDPEMTVVVPMAGSGRRFAEAGYTTPKPLIPVNGVPMIQLAVEALKVKARYVFLVRSQDLKSCEFLKSAFPCCKIVPVESLTEGAACTVLLAKNIINNDSPLLIANSDQWVDYDALRFFYSVREVDGGILVFPATETKWSYAAVENGYVTRVAEKEVISPHATVGVYYWHRGSDFVRYAEQMIDKNVRVNNEFYVCPVFNEAIRDGKRVKVFPVKKMLGLGTPEDLSMNLAEIAI